MLFWPGICTDWWWRRGRSSSTSAGSSPTCTGKGMSGASSQAIYIFSANFTSLSPLPLFRMWYSPHIATGYLTRTKRLLPTINFFCAPVPSFPDFHPILILALRLYFFATILLHHFLNSFQYLFCPKTITHPPPSCGKIRGFFSETISRRQLISADTLPSGSTHDLFCNKWIVVFFFIFYFTHQTAICCLHT